MPLSTTPVLPPPPDGSRLLEGGDLPAPFVGGRALCGTHSSGWEEGHHLSSLSLRRDSPSGVETSCAYSPQATRSHRGLSGGSPGAAPRSQGGRVYFAIRTYRSDLTDKRSGPGAELPRLISRNQPRTESRRGNERASLEPDTS